MAAGWRTGSVDLEGETLVFSKLDESERRTRDNAGDKGTSAQRYSVDDIFVPHDPGPWPEGFLCSREDIYGSDGR